jgi:hypothetical protein
MFALPEHEITHRLKVDNPWWQEFKVDKSFSELLRRDYFTNFAKLATNTTLNRAIILMATRRVEKAVMRRQL